MTVIWPAKVYKVLDSVDVKVRSCSDVWTLDNVRTSDEFVVWSLTRDVGLPKDCVGKVNKDMNMSALVVRRVSVTK